MFEVLNDPVKRVITFRASGLIRLDEMKKALGEYKTATDSHKGKTHLLLADMRGMAPLAPEVAQVMGEAIGYGRAHGVVLCAHLSDSGLIRLQSRRVAREAAPDDGTIIDVVSVEEAWRLFEERGPSLLRA